MTDFNEEFNETFAQIKTHLDLCKTVIDTLGDNDKAKVNLQLSELENAIERVKRLRMAA